MRLIYSQINDGYCVVTIHRDEVFVKEAITAAENFYFNHYLPAAYLVCTEEKNRRKAGFSLKRNFTGVNISNQKSY